MVRHRRRHRLFPRHRVEESGDPAPWDAIDPGCVIVTTGVAMGSFYIVHHSCADVAAIGAVLRFGRGSFVRSALFRVNAQRWLL